MNINRNGWLLISLLLLGLYAGMNFQHLLFNDKRIWVKSDEGFLGNVIKTSSMTNSQGDLLISLYKFSEIWLIDRAGRIKRHWNLPFESVFQTEEKSSDSGIFFSAIHMYPEGSLLGVYCQAFPDFFGKGMVHVDWNGKVLWKLLAHFHHAVYVAKNDLIYALDHDFSTKVINRKSYTFLLDNILIINKEGLILNKINVLDSFLGTRFEPLWDLNKKVELEDIGHTNSIQVLEEDIASHFPQFKKGDLLISIREQNLVAVLDGITHKAIWAQQGPWKEQHDARFLPNGNISVFDNKGLSDGKRERSRVLEFDIKKNKIVWSYSGTSKSPVFSKWKGSAEFLENRNVLIMNSWAGNVFEIDRSGSILWEWNSPNKAPVENVLLIK